MEIGQIIREWRKANGMSQRELAERLRCGTHTVMAAPHAEVQFPITVEITAS